MPDIKNEGTFMYTFNQALGERERIFKLQSAVLNGSLLVVTFIVNAEKYDALLTEELKLKVYNITKSIVPSSFDVQIKYKKTITEPAYITSCITKYIYDTSPMLYSKLNGDSITSEISYSIVNVFINVSPMIFSYMRENGIDTAIQDMLNLEIMEEVAVTLVKDVKIDDTVVFKRKAVQHTNVENEIRTVTIATKQEVIGMIAKMPRYIADVNHAESNLETICGKVSKFSVRESKNSGKIYYTFDLDDSTATISVLYFPYNEKQGKRLADMVTDGEQVVAEGQIKADTRNNSYKMFLKRLALADIDYSTIQTGIKYLDAAEDYVTILPEAYEDSEQGSLLSFDGMSLATEQRLPSALKGDFVVFDLETTGLSQTECKIIEIGAVKMRDGVIIETFSTLINPGGHIPDDATAVNNITDEMVKNCPVFGEVIGDFYKFTRGATLVAHNASFDVGFITYHARKCFYNFDNDVVDTLQMAVGIYGTNSRNNLGALCKRLNIDLEGAHRAVNDATATAKAFRKMCYLGNKE